MDAGKLNKRITFYQDEGTQDSNGQTIANWTAVATVWASVRPLSGKQLALAQANTITSTATHDIRIRYNPALRGQVNYRISYAGWEASPSPTPPTRYFRINSIVDTEERHFELRLMVTEIVDLNAQVTE